LEDFISLPGNHTFKEIVEKVSSLTKEKEFTLFGRIDSSAEAAK
jgi:hypothetical protein